MQELENFRKNLKAKRKKIGLTQSQVEEKVGVCAETICAWERGYYIPKMDSAILVAKALGCTLDEMCEMTTPKNEVRE